MAIQVTYFFLDVFGQLVAFKESVHFIQVILFWGIKLFTVSYYYSFYC